MKPRYVITLFGAVAVALSLMVVMPTDVSSQEDPDARVVEIKDIMAGIHKPAMDNVASIFKKAPETDEEWAKVALSARLINESGHLLMQNNRCPDAVWAKACSNLRAFTATYAKAAMKHDLAGAKAACAQIGASCKSCHDQHREES